MLDIGWTEFGLIAVIALIVIGPKDLPHVVRALGRWSGKARRYTQDFRRNFEGIAEESELAAVRRELEEANRELGQARQLTHEPRIDPTGAGAKTVDKGNGAEAPVAAEAAPESPRLPSAPAVAGPPADTAQAGRPAGEQP